MLFRKHLTTSLLSLILLVLLSLIQPHQDHVITEAQTNDATCDQLVQTALEAVANTCLNLGLNEVCYGNHRVSAVLNDPEMFFEAPGDIVPLTSLDAIITRPVDLVTGEWGVALMNLEADLPDGENSMRLVLFGDVEVTPTQTELVSNLPTCIFSNTANDSMNMRAGPGTNYGVVDILDQGDSVAVTGQNLGGDWVQSPRGWLYEPFGTLECGENVLRTIENTVDSYVAPMQAFSLQISEDAQCQTAPSGMLIQSPSGQTANIMVNNIELRIGSTAFIGLPIESSSEEGVNELIVADIEGDVALTIGRQTQPLIAGTQITVETDPEGVSHFASSRTPFDTSVYFLDDLLSSTLPTVVAAPPPVGVSSGSGDASENRLTVPNVRCQVGQNPGSAAQYFSSDGATIINVSTTSNGAGAATITLESLATSRSISYIFRCNSVGTTTFTTTIIDSNGRTVSDTFTVTVH